MRTGNYAGVVAAGRGVRLNAAVNKVLAMPAIRKQIQESGGEPALSASPKAFADFVRAENAKWAEVIRLTGVTAT